MKFSSFLVLLLIPISLRAQEAQWAYYGASIYNKNKICVFYETNNIKFTQNNYIRVWSKAIYNSKINKYFNKQRLPKSPKGKLPPAAEGTARKIAAHYVPPYERLFKLTQEQRFDIIFDEEYAMLPEANTLMRILFEFDCQNQMYRILSVVTSSKSYSTPNSAWNFIPPESNISTLSKLVCPQ